MLQIGSERVPRIPQLFVLISDGLLVGILSKIANDFILDGVTKFTDDEIDSIQDRLTLGTIVHGPGLFTASA